MTKKFSTVYQEIPTLVNLTKKMATSKRPQSVKMVEAHKVKISSLLKESQIVEASLIDNISNLSKQASMKHLSLAKTSYRKLAGRIAELHISDSVVTASLRAADGYVDGVCDDSISSLRSSIKRVEAASNNISKDYTISETEEVLGKLYKASKANLTSSEISQACEEKAASVFRSVSAKVAEFNLLEAVTEEPTAEDKTKTEEVNPLGDAETPKEETPKEEADKEEAPKEEAPKEETPKEETPKEEALKEETDKEEKEETDKEEKEESNKESSFDDGDFDFDDDGDDDTTYEGDIDNDFEQLVSEDMGEDFGEQESGDSLDGDMGDLISSEMMGEDTSDLYKEGNSVAKRSSKSIALQLSKAKSASKSDVSEDSLEQLINQELLG